MSIAIPKTYRALQLLAIGGLENFKFANLPIVPPSAGNVLVKIRATAIGYRDILDRKGAFKGIKLPAVIGHEFSGTVVAVGKDTPQYSVGDDVLSLHWDQAKTWPSPLSKSKDGSDNFWVGLTAPGGYAEYITMPIGAIAPAPTPEFSYIESACINSTYGTAYEALFKKGGLHNPISLENNKKLNSEALEANSKMRVLVTGATGGVGTAGLKLAKAAGANVTAIVTSKEQADALKEVVDVDEIIVCGTEKSKDSKTTISTFKPSRKVDIVFETVGEPTFNSSLRSLKPGGSLIFIGNVTNGSAPIPLGYVILNALKIWGSNSVHFSTLVSELYPMMKYYSIKPVVGRVISFDQVPEAHAALEARSVVGRIVIDMDKQQIKK